jgi:hypothetical protein
MKVGFSFGRCIRDIVNGEVDIKDVAVIIARTRMEDDNAILDVVAEYMYTPGYLLGLDVDKCNEVALQLQHDGKLHQPRNFGKYPVRIREEHVWMDLVPTNINDNETVKSAWEQYQIALRLTDVLPQPPEVL